MWIDFEERLSKVFSEIDAKGQDGDELGTLYLRLSRHSYPRNHQPALHRSNVINHAQISAGWRRSGVWHMFADQKNPKPEEPKEPKEAMESGATISFSQDIRGKVIVLLSPYTSDVSKVLEKDILLRAELDPTDLSEKEIRRVLKTYLRYCTATSMVCAGTSFWDYLFRLWLGFKDIRNRKRHLLRILTAGGSAVVTIGGGVISLYADGKWPFN
jgi:hypothetical protein